LKFLYLELPIVRAVACFYQLTLKLTEFVTYKAIQARIKSRKGRRAKNKIPAWGWKKAWAKEREQGIQSSCPTQRAATERQRVLAAWRDRWQAQEAQRQNKPDYWDQIKRQPDQAVLQLHKGLRKAESTIIIHGRTGRMGLRHCLHKLRVPDCESSQCSCSAEAETLRHVLLECPHKAERRLDLIKAQGGQLDYNRLLCTPRGARIASKWIIQPGRILQFQLAGSLLYRGEEDE
jgi:hypothetical protein